MSPDAFTHPLLAGDSATVRRLASGSTDPRSVAALAFAHILDSDFDAAIAIATSAPPVAEGSIAALEINAVRILGNAMAGTSQADLGELSDRVAASGPLRLQEGAWAVCMVGEAGMSTGRLDVAERVALRLVEVLPPEDPHRVFAGQTAARALLFQGRLPAAAELATQTLPLASRHDLVALRLVLRGTLAYIAALREDRDALRECVDEVESFAGACPPGYLVSGAFVLSAYALAAAGQGVRASELLLAGAGGPELTALQNLDRAYGYELLVTAALTTSDLAAARAWADRAATVPTGSSEMTAAALHRITARIAVAEGDHRTSAALAEIAAELAHGTSGHLDATRARLMAGSALLHDSDPAGAQARLRDAGVDATQMGAASLSMLARRDLRSIGLRFTGVAQEPMSRREREVAEFVLAGSTNAQIARALGVSERTVHSHVSGVLRALGVPSRAALATGLGMDEAPSADSWALLTPRQQDVARLVSRGYTNDGIARELRVSAKTVEKHLGDCYRRLEVDSRAAMTARLNGR
ncbi:LuxR C-terminal-related transcriptional regulator [Jatrophihabitans sp.]|uniref:LuxR C-terminal-related transcriptional regulator n=1 Tax=Jatrophihabitans sp. TaxID=1932789 RepID=UPI0030C7225A